jgi:hypothetical protein
MLMQKYDLTKDKVIQIKKRAIKKMKASKSINLLRDDIVIKEKKEKRQESWLKEKNIL